MTPSISRRTSAAAAVTTGTLLLSACGAGGSGQLSLHDQLPDAIRKAGVIKVGASLTAAPVIFANPQGKPDGLDADIAAALEKQLGVKLEFQDVGVFGNVLPGLLGKKYDVALSGITDTREREQGVDTHGAQVNEGVDFVDYFMAGVGIVVKKGNPNHFKNLDDLCGHAVAVKKATIHDDLANNQKKACSRAGKPQLNVLETDADSKSQDAVHGGTADAYLTDFPKAAYGAQTVNQGQDFEIVGPQLEPRPYGIALRKSDTALRDVLTKALNALVVSGDYDAILQKRQLTAGAVQNAVVNGST